MADYSKYAKLDADTLKSLKEAYAKEGVGSMQDMGGYDSFGQQQFVPTSANGFQINANIVANPNYGSEASLSSGNNESDLMKGKDVDSYSKQIGDNVYIYNTKGDLTQVRPTGGRWGDTVNMIKYLAPAVLGMGFPGAGAALGSTLGVGATAGSALLQAGLAGVTGGDPLKAGLLSALGSSSGVGVGDTGFTVGDALKGVNVAKTVSSGNLMGALTGAASMAGGTDVEIGDTGYTVGDLMKNGKLLQSVLSGNPKAVMSAVTKFADNAQANANATNTPDQTATTTENSKFMESLAPYLGGSSSAPKTAAAPTAQPTVGIDPMALLQAQMAGDNGGAQIKSNYNLFGKELFGPDKASASSTQDRNAPQSDALMEALGNGGYDEQEFSGGGDVHALLQLLRS